MYKFYGADNCESLKDDRGLTPCDYYDILSGIWCEFTCTPSMRKDWSAANKTLGQCSITAFLMQDIYGGKVLGIRTENGGCHCFNLVGGIVFDLTSEQFGSRILDYEDCSEQARDIHFANSVKRERYEYLKACLFEVLEKD